MLLLQIRPKTICILFATLLTLQSCTIYHRAHITFEQAAVLDRNVKLTRTNGDRIKFDRIVYENATYYGIKDTKGEIIKVPLDPADIDFIRSKDKTSSIIGTILVTLGITLLIAFGIFAATWDWTIGPG